MLYFADDGWETVGLTRIISKNINSIVKSVFQGIKIVEHADNLAQVSTNVILDEKNDKCFALLNSWNCHKKADDDKESFHILEAKQRKVVRNTTEEII
jgi:hypothetical protein